MSFYHFCIYFTIFLLCSCASTNNIKFEQLIKDDQLYQKKIQAYETHELIDDRGYSLLNFLILEDAQRKIKEYYESGHSFHVKDSDGLTPIELIVFFDKKEVFEFIINNKISLNLPKNNSYWYSLKSFEMFELLMHYYKILKLDVPILELTVFINQTLKERALTPKEQKDYLKMLKCLKQW